MDAAAGAIQVGPYRESHVIGLLANLTVLRALLDELQQANKLRFYSRELNGQDTTRGGFFCRRNPLES